MREQKEQEKQNELLRVVAEQNHERLIEYDVKEDRAVVYAIENDRFEVLFDIEDYVKKNHYGSVFIDPEDKKVFRRAMHACLQKEGTVTVDVRYCEKENQPEWYRFYLVSIAEEDGKTDRMVGRFCCVQQEKAINPFLRVHEPAVRASAVAHDPSVSSPVEVFAALRAWKDHFSI